MSILVDENTTFIIQGITGREAVNITRECLDYGSQIVGGAARGREAAGGDVVPLQPGAAIYITSFRVVIMRPCGGGSRTKL